MTTDNDLLTAKNTPTAASLRKIVISSTIGAVLEWFDFFVFASLSGLILGRLFFSPTDPVAEILLGFSTLAVGYFARPLGGLIFGHFGDKLGRKSMLMITIWLMGLSTVTLGLLPSYSAAGVGATIALVLLRVVQGVAVGGEYGGAALLIIEHSAKSNRRGFYSSWANVGASMGFLLASALLSFLTAVTTKEQFETWGWRIPFLISAVLLLVGSFIRKQIQDTPEFARLKDSGQEKKKQSIHKVPLLSLIRKQWRALITAFAVPLTTLVFYQIGLVFITPYATQHAGYQASTVLAAISVAQLLYIALSVSFAYLSDRIGRRPVIAFGAIGCAVWGFVYFTILNDGSFPRLLLAVTGLLFFVAATWGPQAAFQAELFTADVRYSGISAGYQLAGAISGLTPLIAFAMLSSLGTWLPIAICTAMVAVIGAIGLATTRETAFEPLKD
ncbi:MFS transporter [Arthrobacter sp. M4]|uniref:MFS transporter n=1 Tax=Arthrobacter sp. M4 TaxID=218160 RepID=UPI001CDBC527|nr:MFS transporter [Arthrobacter sp. M4]MCA4134808.1 MHS family MFS transporter [Arthrobacter sp. M4]